MTPIENIDRHITAIYAMEAATGLVHSTSQIVAHVERQMIVDGFGVTDEDLIRDRLKAIRAARAGNG